MNSKENPNIEELLNSYIDGELTKKQRIEAQQLISHDQQVAQRLRELQKSKMLVESLPRAEAPSDMMDEIRASLEAATPSSESTWRDERAGERVGVRHLLIRKVLTAAAVVGLMAILAAVVYTIMEPTGAPPVAGFRGRLELKTTDLVTIDEAIKRTIEDKGLSDFVTSKSQGDKRIYAVTCSRESVNLLLAGLGDVWERFDSATLLVETKTSGKQVVVEDVSTQQIIDLITPVKPKVIGPEEKIEKPTVPTRADKQEQVHLTIVVGGSE